VREFIVRDTSPKSSEYIN